MTGGEIFLFIFVTYLIIENALDFFVIGRWEKRAYKNSIKNRDLFK